MPEPVASSHRPAAQVTLRGLSASGKTQAKIIAGELGIDAAKQPRCINKAMKQMSRPQLLSALDRQERAIHQQKLHDRLLIVAQRSEDASRAAGKREAAAQRIAGATARSLEQADPELGVALIASPRNPRMLVTHAPETPADCLVPAFHDFHRAKDAADRTAYRIARAQTYLAEMLLDRFPESEEVQVAFSIDGKTVMVSANIDAQNAAIGRFCSDKNAESLIAALTGRHEAALADPAKVDQSDRTIRHAAKLQRHWLTLLEADAAIRVPERVKKQDGKHAELRIADDPAYFLAGVALFHPPTGVREPCIACAIALHEKTGTAPAQATALWLTRPTRKALGLVGSSVEVMGERLSGGILVLAGEQVRFAEKSRIRGNAPDGSPRITASHAADSDSDLESPGPATPVARSPASKRRA